VDSNHHDRIDSEVEKGAFLTFPGIEISFLPVVPAEYRSYHYLADDLRTPAREALRQTPDYQSTPPIPNQGITEAFVRS
jgi:hypothetical protein